jgi:hypothetical protein
VRFSVYILQMKRFFNIKDLSKKLTPKGRGALANLASVEGEVSTIVTCLLLLTKDTGPPCKQPHRPSFGMLCVPVLQSGTVRGLPGFTMLSFCSSHINFQLSNTRALQSLQARLIEVTTGGGGKRLAAGGSSAGAKRVKSAAAAAAMGKTGSAGVPNTEVGISV